jgi:hypothetical protein
VLSVLLLEQVSKKSQSPNLISAAVVLMTTRLPSRHALPSALALVSPFGVSGIPTRGVQAPRHCSSTATTGRRQHIRPCSMLWHKRYLFNYTCFLPFTLLRSSLNVFLCAKIVNLYIFIPLKDLYEELTWNGKPLRLLANFILSKWSLEH